MATRYKIRDQQALHYLTLTVVGWVDVFTRKRYRDIILESLKYCQEHKGLKVFGYVIMSNHLHLLVLTEGTDLSDVLRDFKKFTARSILKAIETEPESRRDWLLYLFKFFAKGSPVQNREHQFWQTDNHAFELWSLKMIWQKLHYIHDNPVRAGLVSKNCDYMYSSAMNYAFGYGLLEVELMEFEME